MSVTFVNNTAETFTPTKSGAIATHIWECCREAVRDGADPLVVGMCSDGVPYDGVRSILINYPWMPKHPFLTRVLRAQRKVSGWRHLRQGDFAKRIATVIEKAGAAAGVLILHNDPELAVCFRKRFRKAFIVHHFHNHLECRARFRGRFRAAVNVTTAVSRFTSAWVEKYYNCGAVTTIYNGVDSERFRPGGQRHMDLPMINFTGRTGIEKAPDILLRAACVLLKRTSDFRLQILGSNHWQKFEWDDYQRDLKRLCDELEEKGIHVERAGHIDRASLPAKLQNADIHVVPSRWDEPFGLTTAEGMATGLAIVASRTGGTPELIGDAGILFERESVQELADRLFELVTEREKRERYGRKARERAEQFTWRRTWEGFEGVLR